MNTQKIRNIIKLYKQHFDKTHNGEIYKWEAVKCFQNNWNIEAELFPEMLDNALALSKNLLDSGRYFPKRMLHHNAARSPEPLRLLFRTLYNEDQDLLKRITNFQKDLSSTNKNNFKGKNDYQDHRAIMVYLSLRYPDRYYLYKFGLLRDFAAIVDFPYKPKNGVIENVSQYLNLCDLLREEIIEDAELLQLHRKRLTDKCYNDTSYHLLTQDVIYAAVNYLDGFSQPISTEPVFNRLTEVQKTINPRLDQVQLIGAIINHTERQIENKRIGDLGELLVMEYEQKRLKNLGIRKEPVQKSKKEGDGLGYDILSFDENGEEIFIEVKTTKGKFNLPFYITRNELIRSQKDSKKFVLYRLFDYNVNSNTAEFFKNFGDLSDLCINPIQYRVIL
jgi:hypothetical protein